MNTDEALRKANENIEALTQFGREGMEKSLAFKLVVYFLLFSGLCGVLALPMLVVWNFYVNGIPEPPTEKTQQELKVEADRDEGDRLARLTVYYYDATTGECFARYTGQGGGISRVQYEKVKHVLLNPPKEPPE